MRDLCGQPVRAQTCHMRGVSVYTPVGCREFNLPANRNWYQTKSQTVKNAKSSSFSSSNCFDRNLLTRTKVTGRPVTLYGTSNQFEHQHGSRILRVLRTLVFVAVVLVGREGWFYILVESLSYIRRVIFCIIFSLVQNQVVNLRVLEGRLDQSEYPMF